ncbi:hypothetical protein OS493_035702 [Desmophyllum pertusum]|uniref:Uncharacterized protein n=1 Tax=Desmophyllum pertusum TaxID=174260 RepID=A0A9W9YJV6_9CNID|nr:hypothetical protein OS493_035702 [Desmophyllum pertusum]
MSDVVGRILVGTLVEGDAVELVGSLVEGVAVELVGSLVEGATTDELVDSFNTDDDDNEAEGSTLVEYGNELVEGDVPTKLWVSDDVTGATADELVDSFNTDDDDK